MSAIESVIVMPETHASSELAAVPCSASVLFLDIDGVLNSRDAAIAKRCVRLNRNDDGTYEVKVGGGLLGIDPLAVPLLNRILTESGATCILSSTWRMFGRQLCMDNLRHCGFAHDIPDSTPVLFKRRGLEIQHWLDRHPEVERFVILDDDSDMEHLMPHLVNTKFETGLTPEIAAEVIRRLNV